jgi:hypothetical protein
MQVPVDGRRQYSLTDVAVNVGMGRPGRFEQIGPDRYVLANSWPTPRPQPMATSGAPSPIEAPAPNRPKTAGQALWPHLPA